MLVHAREVQEGDFLPGLDNGYVVEVEPGDGYLSYPRTEFGASIAMPDDTYLITYHDADGEECYLLLPADSWLTVER